MNINVLKHLRGIHDVQSLNVLVQPKIFGGEKKLFVVVFSLKFFSRTMLS